MTNRHILSSLIVLRVHLGLARSHVDVVVVAWFKTVAAVKNSLALSLNAYLIVHTLVYISWIALALSLHLLGVLIVSGVLML